jgi:hypothetical protein
MDFIQMHTVTVDFPCSIEWSAEGSMTADASGIKADHSAILETFFLWLVVATATLIFNMTMTPLLRDAWATFVENIKDALRCMGL